jgi:hypothetical protein
MFSKNAPPTYRQVIGCCDCGSVRAARFGAERLTRRRCFLGVFPHAGGEKSQAANRASGAYRSLTMIEFSVNKTVGCWIRGFFIKKVFQNGL